MFFLETRGTWREMGRQYGEAFRTQLSECFQYYASWLFKEPAKYAPTIAVIESELAKHCPELLEETAGMAEVLRMDPRMLIGCRFFNEVRYRMKTGCSAIFLAETPEGPLLGRNCDLNERDGTIQLCRVTRPSNGPASIMTTYLGMSSGQGLNEHGLAYGGASAHTDHSYGNEGLPNAVLQHLMLHQCRTVADATALLARHSFLGKPGNLIVGDEHGASTLFEFAPGRSPNPVPRSPQRQWQACTNFFVSGVIPIKPKASYLYSAYARYGRIVHQLDGGLLKPSLTNLQQLLTEVAQPGLCIETTRMPTAYSQVMLCRSRKMMLSESHPAKTEYKEISL